MTTDDRTLTTALDRLTTVAQLAVRGHGENHSAYRSDLIRRLRNAGFAVEQDQAALPMRHPAVDLVCRFGSIPFGIAIDKESPRGPVLDRLRAFDGRRVLILRRGRSVMPVAGVDAVIGARARRYARGRHLGDDVRSANDPWAAHAA